MSSQFLLISLVIFSYIFSLAFTSRCALLKLKSKLNDTIESNISHGEQLFSKWENLRDEAGIPKSQEGEEFLIKEEESAICSVQTCIMQYMSGSEMRCSDSIFGISGDEAIVISVRCSCKATSESCWLRSPSCELVDLEDDECGRLYLEEHCQTCNYGYISMVDEFSVEYYSPKLIMSVVIRPNCVVSLVSHWEVDTDRKTEDITYFKQTTHTIVGLNLNATTSYVTCSCSENVSSITTSLPSMILTTISDETATLEVAEDVEDSTTVIFALVGAIGGIIVLLGATCFIRKENINFWFVLTKKGTPKKSVSVEPKQLEFDSLEGSNNVSIQDLNECTTQTEQCSTDATECLDTWMQHSDNLDISGNVMKIPKDKLEVPGQLEILGRGRFGNVTKEKLKLDDGTFQEVAVKRVKANADRNYFCSLLHELKAFSHIGSHANIVQLIGYYKGDIHKREVFLVLELCTNGDLKKYLVENRTIFLDLLVEENWPSFHLFSFTTVNLMKWALEIASAMVHLGIKQLVHIDLAARNVFLTENFVAKIGDFGLARCLNDREHYTKTTGEDPIPWPWLALESLQRNEFTIQSDVWSYGVTLWEIFSIGEEPYADIRNVSELNTFLSSNGRMSIPRYATMEIFALISGCWNLQPNQRPTFSELEGFFQQTLSDLLEDLETYATRLKNEGEQEKAYTTFNFLSTNQLS